MVGLELRTAEHEEEHGGTDVVGVAYGVVGEA